MSGIVAIYDPDPEADHHRQGMHMLARLAHRGSDQAGIRKHGPTWLGQLRLAVIDPVGGAQPLRSTTGWWLIANGEIYNHRQIRQQTAYEFTTGSDCEAILAVLQSGGTDDLVRLDGMFAFVATRPDGAVVAARDRLGIKPLYWARVGGATYFASELGAFDVDMRPAVEVFPPGHVWLPDEGLTAFPPRPAAAAPASEQEASERIRTELLNAVGAQLDADVPLGVFLSGGLDSSLIAAAVASHREPDTVIHSFAAGTAESSDLPAARAVAEHLGLTHHELIYTTEEVLDVLPEVVARIESYEPSLVRSSVPNYLLAAMASDTITVAMTGEGADELFAGYDYLRDAEDHSDLAAELRRSVAGMHNLGLQRSDRVTMAHGIEARVPFLAENVVQLAMSIPAEWKLPGDYGQEKKLLRKAFDGWLPEELLWRPKEQFGTGSGMESVMDDMISNLVSDEEWAHAQHGSRVGNLPTPRSKEELVYQRMFSAHLDGIRPEVVGRFATT